jgi:small-conductance mechanosensitive channel
MTDHDWTPLLVGGSMAVVLIVAGPIVQYALRRAGRTSFAADLHRLRLPVDLFAIAITARSATFVVDEQPFTAMARGLVFAAVAWLVIRCLWVAEQVVFRRLEIDVVDNLRARSRRTQLELVRRVATVVIGVGATVVALLVLTPLGRAGPTVVAYAGLIGSVAVRIWDDRRLVLPTSRFVNDSFENWTRSSAELTGSVYAWVDHGTDIDGLRAEVGRLLADHRNWDGRFFTVQVTEIGERAVQVRILVTAASAPVLWDLRCEMREALLPHLASGDDLPVVRLRTDDELVAARSPGSREGVW